MRLYPKKLRSIDDLKRERKLLLKQSRQLEEEEFLPIEGLLGKKRSEGEDKEGGSLLDFLPVSSPLVDIAVRMIKSRFKKNKDTRDDDPNCDNKKKGRSILRRLAFEFVGGYLKWKAIELSFKGIRHILKTRREKSNS